MKPFLHSRSSVHRFGGIPSDYQAIHDFIDSSKAHFADMRHRAILHSSFGIYITEQVFGINIENSDGKLVSVRDIAEWHVLEDLGRIPPVSAYLENMPFYHWLGGDKRSKHEQTVDADSEDFDAPSAVRRPRSLPAVDAGTMVIDTAASIRRSRKLLD